MGGTIFRNVQYGSTRDVPDVIIETTCTGYAILQRLFDLDDEFDQYSQFKMGGLNENLSFTVEVFFFTNGVPIGEDVSVELKCRVTKVVS